MRRLIVLAALALSACGGGDPNPYQPPAPDLASNFNGPIDARGASPQWGLTIRCLDFVLARDGQPDLPGRAPGAVLSAHTASWSVGLPGGQIMKVKLYASACTDAVSGAAMPFVAEVSPPQGGLLSGCAGKPATR